jgi:hypothetical protein
VVFHITTRKPTLPKKTTDDFLSIALDPFQKMQAGYVTGILGKLLENLSRRPGILKTDPGANCADSRIGHHAIYIVIHSA